MNQSPDFDVVILGGGMTGLTLAHHIAQHNAAQPARGLKTLVLEPRESYRRDKTWCYWRQASTPFDEAITHQWSQWSVSFNGETQVCRSEHMPYVRVDSGRFYDIAQRDIEVSDSVTLRLGEAATTMTAHHAGVVITSARDPLRQNGLRYAPRTATQGHTATALRRLGDRNRTRRL